MVSNLMPWVLAVRLKTLPAAIVPVLVGTAVAVAAGKFAPLAAFAALLGALLIQVGTNLANDYFDFKSGADDEHRLGPTRVTQAGLLSAEAVRRAMIMAFLASAAVGSYLVVVGGWPVLVIGVLSIASGIAYTGGPYPLGYHGLGDLFVFVFFGVVAVCGTYWVQALEWSWTALAASVPIGLLSVAILVVNNVRDIDTDRRTGKNTLAVRLGPRLTRWQWVVCVAVAFAIPTAQVALGASTWLLLPLAAVPLAITLGRDLLVRTGRELNAVLAGTAKLLLIFGLLYAGAYLIGSPGV